MVARASTTPLYGARGIRKVYSYGLGKRKVPRRMKAKWLYKPLRGEYRFSTFKGRQRGMAS